MSEYFVIANSFAAPFLSDTSDGFISADSPEDALMKFAAVYRHPCGLYSAAVYPSADAYHKRAEPLAKWLCNREIEQQRLTRGLASYTFLGHSAGDFEINGVRHTVTDPKGGRIVTESLAKARGEVSNA